MNGKITCVWMAAAIVSIFMIFQTGGEQQQGGQASQKYWEAVGADLPDYSKKSDRQVGGGRPAVQDIGSFEPDRFGPLEKFCDTKGLTEQSNGQGFEGADGIKSPANILRMKKIFLLFLTLQDRKKSF